MKNKKGSNSSLCAYSSKIPQNPKERREDYYKFYSNSDDIYKSVEGGASHILAIAREKDVVLNNQHKKQLIRRVLDLNEDPEKLNDRLQKFGELSTSQKEIVGQTMDTKRYNDFFSKKRNIGITVEQGIEYIKYMAGEPEEVLSMKKKVQFAKEILKANVDPEEVNSSIQQSIKQSMFTAKRILALATVSLQKEGLLNDRSSNSSISR